MRTIKELVRELEPGQEFFSYEFFPPKTQSGMDNLITRMQRLAELGPLFVSVTWGAGGTTSGKSLKLAAQCSQQLGLVTCLHLTCTNTDVVAIDDALRAARDAGVRNILALRGDLPRAECEADRCADRRELKTDRDRAADKREFMVDRDTADAHFSHAVDLVQYIKNKHKDYFCIGVAGYPEGHAEGTADAESQSPLRDLPYLADKVRAGADFVITQLFYDAQRFLDFLAFVDSAEYRDTFKDTCIIPGLIPISSYQSFIRACKLGHASIPRHVIDRFDALNKDDDDVVKRFGVDVLTEIIATIRSQSHGRVRGFHFYTLNLEKSVASVLDRSGLVRTGRETSDTQQGADTGHREDTGHWAPDSSFDRFSKKLPPATKQALDLSCGKGAVGREATWDDLPNGRFGASRSPAYGEIDVYGVSSVLADKVRAYALWGQPDSEAHISHIFVSHVTGAIDALPFNGHGGLSPETALIQEVLIHMNQRGMWTVASQPAGNAVSSSDRIYGWGPPNGYVYQKAFVEFFATPEQWRALKGRLVSDPVSVSDLVSDPVSSPVSVSVSASGPVPPITYYAAQEHGPLETNLPSNSSSAVTWGIFANREVVQPTIVEEESFLSWRREAFGIWRDWARLYPVDSAAYSVLDKCRRTRYLVSLVHHDYRDFNALWDFVLT